MSASREKRQRQTMTGLSEKEKQAALEAAKAKKKARLYVAIGVVAAIAVAALLIWDSGFIQKNLTAYTVNGHNYTIADVEYFYYSEYNSYYSTYGTYLFDDDLSLKEQTVYTDEDGNAVTWHDMLLADSLSTLEGMTLLYDEAVANGYSLSDEGVEAVEETMAYLSVYAAYYGVTESYYISYLYGEYMTASHLEELLTMYELASEYSDLISEGFVAAVTEAEMDEYYAENADSLDTYDYDVYYIDGTAEETEDEDGNTIEATEEEEEAAMANAYELADALAIALSEGDDDTVQALVDDESGLVHSYGSYAGTKGSSVSANYSDYVTDADRSAGEVGIIESTYGYYVVVFNGRELDEYYPVTYRDIHLTAEVDDDADEPTDEQMENCLANAEAIYELSTTEELFIAQVASTSDSSSVDNEGLNESYLKSSVSDSNVYAWLFNEARSEGDMEIVEDEDGTGYYILYFVGYDETPYWRQSVASTLGSESYSAWYEELSADITTSNGMGYGLIG